MLKKIINFCTDFWKLLTYTPPTGSPFTRFKIMPPKEDDYPPDVAIITQRKIIINKESRMYDINDLR